MMERPTAPPVEFVVSPQFEVCYALAALARPMPGLHRKWVHDTQTRLGPALCAQIGSLGEALWVGLPDVLAGARPGHNLEMLLHGIRSVDVAEFQRRMLEGLLHDSDVVGELTAGRSTAKEAILGLPERKREWLAHIELYPYRPETPSGLLLQRLVRDPDEVRRFSLGTLTEFWDRAFAISWGRLTPEYHASKDRAERLAMSASLRELTTALRLLVEIDDEAGELHALRGGYRIAFRDVERCYVLPSAFNVRRFWTTHERPARSAVVYLPFFDHTLQVDRASALVAPDTESTEIDPALICKVLGDATRLSALKLLAERPRNSAELARELGLSRPTVSHHVFLMREAGLIDQRARGKSVEISVNRPTVEALSGALVERLFGVAPAP